MLEKQDFFEDSALPIQIHIRDPQPEFPMHQHQFDELVIILKGTARHVINDQSFSVKGGDVFVIAPKNRHQHQEMHGLSLANILFDSKALAMEQWDIQTLPGSHALFLLEPVYRAQHNFRSHLQLPEHEMKHVTDIIHKLTLEADKRNPGYRVMAKSLFMQLTVHLSRCYSEQPTEESIDLLRIGDAIALMETHYSEKITLDMLAVRSHLSKRHFLRVFNDCVGRSPIDHLMHIRMQKACELLARSNRTVTDIAFACGFSDGNYFTRCFRKSLKQTPLQFRKER